MFETILKKKKKKLQQHSKSQIIGIQLYLLFYVNEYYIY